MENDYKPAYERQKRAREKAENQLENISRELYESNSALKEAYEKLKNQKSQLLHQEKLASIGQLSAGIAHEINNPSGFIKSNLSSLKNYINDIFTLLVEHKGLTEELTRGLDNQLPSAIGARLITIAKIEETCDLEYLIEDIPSLIDESIDGANRINKIVKGLQVFSRIDSDEKELLDVNECINNTLKLVQNEIKYKAEIVIRLSDVPKTMGYPGGLSQVILNLLVNASHAIAEFGEISVETLQRDKNIIIIVKDNGSGISDEKIGKIFDPFFTTKDVGSGTGLGLSISAGIIKQHDGEIEVDSEVGKGTTFSLNIPIVKPSC